jgi:LysM repeat protein
MQKRSTAPARTLAAIALVAGFVAVIAVISSTGGGGSGGSGGGASTSKAVHRTNRPKTKAAAYVVQTGDTLTSIAHRTGVSVVRIQRLNPEADPQILIAGEKLKLR